MIIDNNYPLRGWLKCYPALLELGFSDEEIDQALEKSGMNENLLTEKVFFEKDPAHLKNEHSKTPARFEGKGSGTVTRYLNHGGLQYEARETVHGYYYRMLGQYQGLKHEKIIRELLKARFVWFDRFSWSIYELSNVDYYEIYLKTKAGSLYVPIRALLDQDPQKIVDRMVSYFKTYRLASSYELNKRAGETFEDFETRKRKEYRKDLDPMFTISAQKLFSYIRGGNEE